MQKELTTIQKDLLKDPTYQEELIKFFGQPDMQKQLETLLKGTELRKEMEKVVKETIESPTLQNQWLELLKKSGETESDKKKEEDFDAIFINIAHRAYEENRLITRWTSPIRSSKCFLKPRFATSSLEEFMHFAAYLIDGFCMTAFDDAFADFIENIYTNMPKL